MRFSPQEMSQQKIAEAVQMLQALGPINQQQKLELMQAEQAMEPDELVPFGRGGLAWRRKGSIVRQPEPETQPNRPNTQGIDIILPGMPKDKPIPAIRIMDRDDPDVGKIFIRTPEGLKDVTTEAVEWRAPVQPPYIIRVEGDIDKVAKELPQDWRNVVRRSMPNTLPAATRLGRMNEAAEYIAANDVEGLKSRVRQWAIESENVGTQMQVEGRADAMVAMKDGLALLNNMRREGVDTNILTGTWEEIVRKLGTTSHPKRVEFTSRMQRALSAYTLAMSGVQFSENEAKRYYELFPNASNTLLVNEALAKSLLRSMGAEDKRFWEQKLDVPGAKLVSAIPTEQQQQREIVTYQGRRYYLVGTDANGNAILEPIP